MAAHLFQFLAVEEVAQQLLYPRDAGGSTDEHDLIDLGLVEPAVLQHLLDRGDGALEGGGVDVLEASTGDLRVEVLAVEERVDLDRRLRAVGQRALGPLASGAQATERARVARHVLLGLAGELLLEVVEQVGVEVLSSQVRVARRRLDREHATLDVQQRHVEGAAPEVVDEHVPLLLRLARAQAVGDGGSGGLVDDAEHVQVRNGAGILGRLTLVVVEVGWHGDDGLGDLLAQLGLGHLFHLQTGQRPRCGRQRLARSVVPS